jgi:hypothetical protein
VETLARAQIYRAPAAALDGLSASNGCLSKRDLGGGFNQIRIGLAATTRRCRA